MATIVSYCHTIGACKYGPTENPGDYHIRSLLGSEMTEVYEYCVKNGLDFCQPKGVKATVAAVIHHVTPKVVVPNPIFPNPIVPVHVVPDKVVTK